MPVRENKPSLKQQATFVTFHLGSQTYALPITPVRQIIEMVTITPLPQVNQMIAGVINFHGALVPVINMRHLLGLEEIPLHLHTPMILVYISKRLVGLIVDEVLDVFDRPAEQVIYPHHILPKEMGEIPLLQGLIHTQDGSILLLNPEHLLKPYHAQVISEAVHTLAQNLEQEVPNAAEGSTPADKPSGVKNAGEAGQSEPEAQPVKTSKSRRRKKVTTLPEDNPEGSA